MKWLEKLGLSRRAPVLARAPVPPIHPPWKAGQYVTYLLERNDGSWVALALRILGQSEDGAWAIEGRFKTRRGEAAVLFRSDPSAPADAMDPVPVQQTIVRRAASASGDPEDMLDDPATATSLALNLLLVRRWKGAAESLSKDARPIHYPCGIDRVHLLVTPGPGYQKHHDLCPRVLLTGVACLSIDGGKNPMTVTSFGINDPTAEAPTSYDDFVDLTHPKRVDHDGFTLTYPATWFLASASGEKDGVRMTEHRAQVGGVSCSLACTITIYSGDRRGVGEIRDTTRTRFSGPLAGLSRRKAESLRLPGDAWGAVLDLVQPGIDGVVYAAGCMAGGDRFALVTATGCISRASPRRSETLAAYEQVFRDTVESFRFSEAQ
jgi:hypothetical protein